MSTFEEPPVGSAGTGPRQGEPPGSRPTGGHDGARAAAKPVDTEHHGSVKVRGKSGRTKHETTVWVFSDPRKARARVYRGYEGLPWALTDLVRKTNSAIDRDEVPGKRLDVGDVIQACVVSYYDGEVHKPQTTDDSPRYATLPYRIVRAEGGYLSAEPAIPPETAIHFKLPVTVGDLVPTLSQERRPTVLVSLQLKEAAYGSLPEAIEAAGSQVELAAAYVVSDKAGEEAADFVRFIETEDRDGERTPAVAPPLSKPEPPAPEVLDPEDLDPAERARRDSARLKRKLSGRHDEDMRDFGFEK